MFCYQSSLLSLPDDFVKLEKNKMINLESTTMISDYDNGSNNINNSGLSFDNWLLEQSRFPLSISIPSYSFVKPSFFSSKVAFFLVESTFKSSSFKVQRRFSDFIKLRFTLSLRFPGAFIPPLVGKTTFFQSNQPSSDDSTTVLFLTKRMHALNLFLTYISRNPYFRNDISFIEFYSNEEKFTACLDIIEKNNKQKKEMSTGQIRWNQAISLCESPTNAGIAIQSSIRELTMLHARLKEFKTKLKVLHIKMKQYHTSWNDLGKPIQSWRDIEKRNIGLISGVFNFESRSDPESTQSIFKSLSVVGMLSDGLNMHQEQVDVLKQNLFSLKINVIGKLAFEIRIIEELLIALRKTRSAIIRHRRAMMNFRAQAVLKHINEPSDNNKLLNSDTQSKNGTVTENNSTVTSCKHEESIADDEILSSDEDMRKLLVIQKEAIMSIRGLLVLELGRYRRERTVRISSMMNEIGNIQYFNSDMTKKIWSEFASIFPLDLPSTSDLQILSENNLRMDVTSSFPDVSVAELNTLSMIQENQAELYTTGTPMKGLEKINESCSNDIPVLSKRRSSLKVVYDFKAEHHDEISAKAGQVLIGSLNKHDPNWFVARDENGTEGIIPANYVEIINDHPHYEEKLNHDGENQTPNVSKFYSPTKKQLFKEESKQTDTAKKQVNFLSDIRNFNKKKLNEV